MENTIKVPNTYQKCMDRIKKLNSVDCATESEYSILKATQSAERAALDIKLNQLNSGLKRKIVGWATN